MSANLSGAWKPVVNDGLDDYLTKLGIGSMKQNALKKAHKRIEQDGQEFKITMKVNPLMSKQQKLTIGKEMEEKDPNDRKVTVLPELDGNKLIVTITYKEQDMKQFVTREVIGDELVMNMELFQEGKSVAKCVRKFQRE